MKYPKRSQYKYAKSRYRVRNWVEYEAGLSDLTGRRTPDCARAPALIEQLEDPVASVSADGAYDTAGVYDTRQLE